MHFLSSFGKRNAAGKALFVTTLLASHTISNTLALPLPPHGDGSDADEDKHVSAAEKAAEIHDIFTHPGQRIVRVMGERVTKAGDALDGKISHISDVVSHDLNQATDIKNALLHGKSRNDDEESGKRKRDLSSVVNLGYPLAFDQGSFSLGSSQQAYSAQGSEQLIPAGIRYVDYRWLPGTESLRLTANPNHDISFTTNNSDAALTQDMTLESTEEGMLRFQSDSTNGNEMVDEYLDKRTDDPIISQVENTGRGNHVDVVYGHGSEEAATRDKMWKKEQKAKKGSGMGTALKWTAGVAAAGALGYWIHGKWKASKAKGKVAPEPAAPPAPITAASEVAAPVEPAAAGAGGPKRRDVRSIEERSKESTTTINSIVKRAVIGKK